MNNLGQPAVAGVLARPQLESPIRQLLDELDRLDHELITAHHKHDHLKERFNRLHFLLESYQLAANHNGQSPWDVFESSVLGLREDQIDDAINVLQMMRQTLRADREENEARGCHSEASAGGSDLTSASDATPGNEKITTFGTVEKSPAPTPASDTKKKPQKTKTRPSLETLKRVTSRQVLATQFSNIVDFFKKERKESKADKGKGPSSQTPIEEEAEEDDIELSGGKSNVVTTYHETGEVLDQQSTSPKRVSASQSTTLAPVIRINGLRHDSQELERRIIEKLERSLSLTPRPSGSASQLDMSGGSHDKDGEVFSDYLQVPKEVTKASNIRRRSAPPTSPVESGLRRTDDCQLQNHPDFSNGQNIIFHQPHLSSPQRKLRHNSTPVRVAAQKKINRATSVIALHGEYDWDPVPPTPPPTKPLPPIPSTPRERPVSSPPYVQSQVKVDDPFRPRTASPVATETVLATQRFRNFPATPTPKFVPHRGESPSPGGNGPLGEVGELGWQKEKQS